MACDVNYVLRSWAKDMHMLIISCRAYRDVGDIGVWELGRLSRMCFAKTEWQILFSLSK
jgi:hypothetical protein